MSFTTKKRILFFSPLAARNGAEMMLLHLVNNIDKNRFEVAVFFNQQGELVNDFRSRGIRVYVSPYRQQRFHFHYNRLRKKYLGKSAYDKFIEKIHAEFKPDAWYLNTLKLSHLVPLAAQLKVKVIIHSHENKFQLSEFKKHETENVLKADILIGCAKWVSETYRELGMKNVHTLYEMVDLSEIKTDTGRIQELKKKIQHTKRGLCVADEWQHRIPKGNRPDTGAGTKDKPAKCKVFMVRPNTG